MFIKVFQIFFYLVCQGCGSKSYLCDQSDVDDKNYAKLIKIFHAELRVEGFFVILRLKNSN